MKTKLLLIIALSALCGWNANAQSNNANAGVDQEICTNSTTLNGNVLSCSCPQWSVLSGSATFDCPTCTTTTVTIGCGVNVLILTPVWCGWSCPSWTKDTVIITRHCAPTPANAGNDQNGCNSSSYTLSGNTPTVGTGTWSIVSGTATIANPSLPNSTVTGIAAGNSATLRWTISNGANVCPGNVSTDDVVLANNAMPNVTASGNNESCYGCCNGNATANTTGGTTPYNYYWSNGLTTSTITGLCAGTYTVTITDAKNCQDTASAIVTFVGISEIENPHFTLFPNPTSGIFTLSVPAPEKTSIKIYNVLGDIIYQSEEWQIDLSHKPKGIYFIQVHAGEETFFQKLVVY